MTDGFGTVTWWGFSPALDLQEDGFAKTLSKLKIEEDDHPDVQNILLVGAGDIRHVLKTIARRYRHKRKKLHIYIYESALELYGRDMLMLMIALESPKRMGLQEKMELFLEVYGNILVRRQSALYVEQASNELIRMVTDFDYMAKLMPTLDLSNLKFKERDFLEGIFKFWRNPDKKIFDVSTHWDNRLRKHLGVRYDSKMNIFDWDYNMRLVDVKADIINRKEYQKWRLTGLGFEIREGTYDIPNKTMASGMIFKRDGERVAARGYWGDIVVSPYITMGLHTEEESFYKKQNDIFEKTAQDITAHNVLSMFHEILHHTKYEVPKKEERKAELAPAKLEEILEEEDEDAAEKEAEEGKREEAGAEAGAPVETLETCSAASNPLDQKYEAVPLEDVKISFLPLQSLHDLGKKSKFQKLFDMAYFSNSLVHLLTTELQPIFADRCTVIVESARYMVELKVKNTVEFAKKVVGIAQTAGCKELETDQESNNHLKFLYQRAAES